MRVLAMVPSYPPMRCVGSWMMTHELMRALVGRGHGVDVVLSAEQGDPYEIDGVRVWPHTGKSDPFRYVDQVSLIVAHAESAGRAAAIGEMRGVPVVRIAHNTSVMTEAALLKRRVALTVFNSAHMAAAYGRSVGRSIVVHPPVRVADYATTPGEAVTLVNLCEAKGAETFYALADRFPGQPFLGVQGGYGVQVMPGPDGPGNVEILDHLPADQMRVRVYARTRILLMPSHHESWGRTAVEAMCSGIPVVASPVPGLRECLGAAGTYAAVGDVEGWERALRHLLDGRRWRRASRLAAARVAELDPAADLARWCEAAEDIARRRVRGRARAAV